MLNLMLSDVPAKKCQACGVLFEAGASRLAWRQRYCPGCLATDAGRECECGSPIAFGLETCERCAYLDGATKRPARFIHALRAQSGIATTYEIAARTGMDDRAVRYVGAQLEDLGRVMRRHYPDTDNNAPTERTLWVLIDSGNNDNATSTKGARRCRSK